MDQFLATQNDVTALYTKVEGNFNFEKPVYILYIIAIINLCLLPRTRPRLVSHARSLHQAHAPVGVHPREDKHTVG